MTEITYIKKLIEESDGVELSNWNTVTHAQREAWAEIETRGRAWIIDFITTIESQKEEIEELKQNWNMVKRNFAVLEDQYQKLKQSSLSTIPEGEK